MEADLFKEEGVLDLLHSIKELILEIKADLVDLLDNIEIEDGEEEEELPSTQNTSASGSRKRKSTK